jgi:hypothetical protein
LAGQPSKPPSAQDKSGNGGSDDAKDKSEGKPPSAAAQGQSPGEKQGEGKSASAGGKDQSQPGNSSVSAGQPPPAEQTPQAGQTPPPAAGVKGESSPRADRPGDSIQSGAGQTPQGADEQRIPGQMSRAEARELLDSVKDDQQRLPAAPLARSGGADSGPSEQPLKDW